MNIVMGQDSPTMLKMMADVAETIVNHNVLVRHGVGWLDAK
jgi:hypothetical protein